jgi:hypothetical protein
MGREQAGREQPDLELADAHAPVPAASAPKTAPVPPPHQEPQHQPEQQPEQVQQRQEPEKALPQPRIIFLGAEPRAHGLIELYRLGGRADFVLADRRQNYIGGQPPAQPVLAFGSFGLDQLDVVIVTEDPIDDFAEALDFLKEEGIPPERIITCAEPGRAHRALSRIVTYPDDYNREIGYLAVRRNLFHRGHYAYCMILAAETALRMSRRRVTAVEFGVWRGSGLKNMCEIADFLQQTLGVEFLLYGFDTGAGLPAVADWRDHPELWATGELAMPNFEELAAQLPENCKLIIGDVKDTLGHFLREQAESDAPIGFVSLDVDQYHSSVSCLRIFDAEPTQLAPVVPVWVDDSYLSVLQTTWAGEGLAIREFNDSHPLRKIEQKIVRTDDYPRLWHHCIYFAHIFDHPIRQGKQTAKFDQFYHTQY